MKSSLFATVGLAVGLMAAPAAFAQDEMMQEEVCNPVIDSTTDTVRSSNGEAVVTGSSFPCPEPEPMAEEEPEMPDTIVIAGDIAFDFDEATIKPEFYPTLDEIVAELSQFPEATVEIVGHTDSVGSEAYNQGLSERRAQAVAQYLENGGISRSNMIVEGMGESQPIATNDTREGRAQNRRVEITAS